ncbi:TonB-dependent receptor domain-containing protein [Altererythrobacter sp. B11]|uniref:TonB-dependent receptor domain-containing protein n=1 Tax=Altererythrobacter sp. B11 TaxID=2060312 RepID=UPI001E29E7B6|nr:TonB-dependent receptor [Altererythrobacter sp. B11]
MRIIRNARVSAHALAIAGLAIGSGAASAQEAAADAAQPPEQAPAPIIVTGSRIQSAFDRPTPVTMLGAERLEERGASNLGDALNELPVFRATQTPATAGLGAEAGYIGGRILDLRGLGAVRTLTLVDGKRFVPSTTQATVDTNMIPSILLSRAEVVTGGASAVYGSDAVSGVVNLLINKDLTGYKMNAQAGISEEGDNFTRQLGLAGGWELGSNLHLIVGGEWEKSDGVSGCEQRDWCRNGLINVGRNPLAPGQVPTIPATSIVPDAYTWSASFNGVTTPPSSAYVGRDVPALRPIDGITFNNDGTPRRYQFGYLVNSIWQAGGERDTPLGKNIYFDFPIVSPTERWSTMGYLTWDATEALTLELGLTYGHGEGRHRSPGHRSTSIVIRDDNPFLPRSSDPTLDIPTILANSGLTSFTLGKGFDDIGPGIVEVKNDVIRVVGAATYQLDGNWQLDAYYSYGHNKFRSDFTNKVITANVGRALDATSVNGTPVCRVNADSDPTNDDPACVPLNPFGYGQGPDFAGAKAYVTADGFQTNVTTQNVVAANLTGNLFTLPAGSVGVAVGGEFRSDKVTGDTDPLSQANAFINGNGALVSGKIDVTEFYGEINVPLLADQPFAREFGVDGAIRQTHYSRSSAMFDSSSVDVTTWKLGAVWAPIDAVRFRVSRSRDIRAPNVAELFGPVTTRTGILTDTGNGGRQVIVEVVSGSNPSLQPESADTWTVGVVLQPTGGFFGRFRASADYYDIKIDDAISTLGQQNIVNRCVDGDALSCSLIQRNADNEVVSIVDTVQNVNQLIARGIDFQLDYVQPLGGTTTLSLNVLASYVDDLITVDSVGATDRAGQTGLRGGTPPGIPDWTVDATARLEFLENYAFTSHFRWINKGFFFPTFLEPGDPGYSLQSPNSVNTNTLPSRFYVDILGSAKLPFGGAKEVEVFAGIDNLFNVDPPRFPGANGSGNNVLFNPVGRMFKGGIRASF